MRRLKSSASWKNYGRKPQEISKDIQALSHEPAFSPAGVPGLGCGYERLLQRVQRRISEWKLTSRSQGPALAPFLPEISLCLFRVLQEGLAQLEAKP